MKCDHQRYHNAPQKIGGWCAFKNTPKSRQFVTEWLKYCCDYRIISDSHNTIHEQNFPNFIRNHHDQCVLSILAVKYNIKPFLLWKEAVQYHFFLRKFVPRRNKHKPNINKTNKKKSNINKTNKQKIKKPNKKKTKKPNKKKINIKNKIKIQKTNKKIIKKQKIKKQK